jgi:glycerol-3-phosphate acyltransferase PlsY
MIAPLPITIALAALVIGYLLGTIPFGLLFAYLSGAGDVRKIGSGSIGATNVLRTGKKWAAALTLLFDAAKGAFAVLLVRHLFGADAALIAAFAVFLGHLYPVWLGFKGGKGVAVSLGILLAVNWPVALIGLATWLVMLAAFRISSLSALATAVAVPIGMWLLGNPHETLLAILLAVLVFIAHRANIKRLIRGEEPRIGGKKIGADVAGA